MKKRNLFIMFLSMIIISSCAVRGVVTDRPADVVYERPLAPGAGYIWINGDWIWSGGSYRWHEGHWERPRNGHNWVSGHWEASGHGWRWNKGRWK
jgi:hypothetical protein